MDKLDQVAASIGDSPIFKALANGSNSGNDKTGKASTSRIAALQDDIKRNRAELVRIEARLEKMVDDLADRVLSSVDYKRGLERNTTRKEQLVSQLQELELQADAYNEDAANHKQELDFATEWGKLSEYARATPFYEWPLEFRQAVKNCLCQMFKSFTVGGGFDHSERHWHINITPAYTSMI